MEKEQNIIPVNLDFNAKIHNRFDIEVRDAKTGELKQQAQAFNVICDALWTRLFNKQSWFSYIIYGRGTGTPSATDTTLFSKIGSSGNLYDHTINVDDSTDDSIISIRNSLTIDTETANGETITEVGIGYDATHIVTHAMLQDMNGNPVSITKTNTDIIYIYATVYVHYESCTSTKSTVINNGTILRISERGGRDTVWSGNIALFILVVSMNSYVFFSPNNFFHYVTGQYYSSYPSDVKDSTITGNSSTKTFTFSLRCLVGEANHSRGITSICFANSSIILDTTKMFNLNNFAITGESLGSGNGTKVNFTTKFPINSSAKVYVDGVEQLSGVTIATGYDREFYKLRKIYNDQHHLIPPARWFFDFDYGDYFYSDIIIENDENITFSGLRYYQKNNRPVIITVYGSDVFGSWTQIATSSTSTAGDHQVAFSQNNYNYYKLHIDGRGTTFDYFYLASPADKTYDVIFDTPPASGSAITIDYIPDCIPKDSNHVLDLTLSLTLGEYSGN